MAETLSAKSPKGRFIAPPTPQWYASILPLGPHGPIPPLTPSSLASFASRASSLHVSDTRTFKESSSSESSFLHKVLQSGTLSDRLSALTLLVQSSPVHNVKALESLKGMAERGKGKGGREECLKALRCVVDWWVGGGAPSRKLKYFRDQPLGHPSVTDQHLLLWHFEDWLKKYFFSILQTLETFSLDPLSYIRTQALTFIFTLLRDKPEQEQNLLRLLVNKLGDTEKSLCSRASYHLLQLLQTHPAMKAVIVREIVTLVLKPPPPPASSAAKRSDDKNPKMQEVKHAGGNIHAQYYATITFNQMVLTIADRDVALQLVHVYFEIFKELLGERKESPEASNEPVKKKGDREPRMDKNGRVMNSGRGLGRGDMKKVKGAAGFAEIEDTDSKLISAILTGVNRALPFAKVDSGDAHLIKHIDTLFLITHTSTFNISLQALVLIQQISASLSSSPSVSSVSRSIIDRYYRTLYASLQDARLATSSKQAMYLNLLFKSIKTDPDKSGERAKAFIRRFVQVLVSGGGGATEFVAGGLFLLGELFAAIPGLRIMLNVNELPKTTNVKAEDANYDPRKRDPEYAHASSSPIWELTPLLHHYHPAISLHARQLLSGQPLTASADLSLNTLSHFLDRFVYKNPKKRRPDASNKGGSAMQPAASALDGTGVKLMKGEVGLSERAVNGEDFLKKKSGDVPVDLLFFHKFFSRKKEKERAKSKKVEKRKDGGGRKKGGSGDEDETSEEEQDSSGDENESEIWKAMKTSMPRATGDDDLMEDSDDLVPEEEGLISSSDDESDENADKGSIEDSDHDDSDKGEVKKRKRSGIEESRGSVKKRMKSLGTFASYEEYAKMIEDDDDDI